MYTLEQISKSGYTDHLGDTKVGGIAARDVYTNWHDDEWRNSFIMALEEFIENQMEIHSKQLEKMIAQARHSTVEKNRQAFMKSYVVSKVKVNVESYTREDGTEVKGYTFDRKHNSPVMRPEDMAAALRQYESRVVPENRPNAQQQVAYHLQDANGATRVVVPDAGKGPEPKDDETIVGAQTLGYQNVHGSDLGLGMNNLALGLGANAHQAGSAGAVVNNLSHIGSQHEWFKRVEAMSKVLFYATGEGAAGAAVGAGIGRLTGHTGLGATIGGGLTWGIGAALAMGEAVGKHGSEVSRVLGPSMRKYTYQYRGMTASPTQFNTTAKDGVQPGEGGSKQLEDRLVHTLASRDYEHAGMGAIPTKAQNALLLQTGTTAPSHGFLIDAKGKVQQQAVGYADDHYVPFNLAKLHALKGGSYVRSRSYGGPTTEDINLAMRSGARRFTTISHNGSYTVEFDPRADTKRWGYTPRQVVNRYGRLLDAIQSGKVADPSGGGNLELNERGYQIALQSLQRQYPLLISSVRHEGPEQPALEGLRGAAGEVDTGYVRPMYLKPSAARAGYHDTLLNPGGSQSYDDLEGYRSVKATHLLAKAKDAEAAKKAEEERLQQERLRQAKEQQHRTGHIAPLGVPQAARNTAEAAATDFGKPVISYPEGGTHAWTEDHGNMMINNALNILQYAANTKQHMDEDANEWYGILDGFLRHRDDVTPEEHEAYADKILALKDGDPDVRSEFYGAINDLTDHLDTEGSGLVPTIQQFQEGAADGAGSMDEPVVGDEDFTHVFVDANGNPKDDDHIEYLKHIEYKRLKQHLADGGFLGEKKTKAIARWETPNNEVSHYEGQSPAAYWDNPHSAPLPSTHPADKYAGLTPTQMHENRIKRAKANEAGEPVVGLAEGDPDMTPPPSEDYEGETMSDIDPNDY